MRSADAGWRWVIRWATKEWDKRTWQPWCCCLLRCSPSDSKIDYFLLFKIDTNPLSQVQTTDYRFASLAILHVFIEFMRISGSGGDRYVKLYCEERGRIFWRNKNLVSLKVPEWALQMNNKIENSMWSRDEIKEFEEGNSWIVFPKCVTLQ